LLASAVSFCAAASLPTSNAWSAIVWSWCPIWMSMVERPLIVSSSFNPVSPSASSVAMDRSERTVDSSVANAGELASEVTPGGVFFDAVCTAGSFAISPRRLTTRSQRSWIWLRYSPTSRCAGGVAGGAVRGVECTGAVSGRGGTGGGCRTAGGRGGTGGGCRTAGGRGGTGGGRRTPGERGGTGGGFRTAGGRGGTGGGRMTVEGGLPRWRERGREPAAVPAPGPAWERSAAVARFPTSRWRERTCSSWGHAASRPGRAAAPSRRAAVGLRLGSRVAFNCSLTMPASPSVASSAGNLRPQVASRTRLTLPPAVPPRLPVRAAERARCARRRIEGRAGGAAAPGGSTVRVPVLGTVRGPCTSRRSP